MPIVLVFLYGKGRVEPLEMNKCGRDSIAIDVAGDQRKSKPRLSARQKLLGVTARQ
jgi:hypothetical protein